MCRNFGKELVILFHRSAAAPWGHVVSIMKKSPTGDSLSLLVPLLQLLAQVVFVAASWRYTFGTFHHRDPRAANACAEFKGTGHGQLSSSRYFICKHTLSTFTFTNLLHYFTLPNLLYNNLATKPYKTLPAFGTLWTLFWTVTYTFIVYSIWCKNPVYCCCCV